MLTEVFNQGGREVLGKHTGQVGVVCQVGLLELCGQVNFHVGSKNSQLRPVEGFTGGFIAFADFFIGGEEFHLAVETSILFEVVNQADIGLDPGNYTVAFCLQQHVLLNVGAQHLSTDVLALGFDEPCALFSRELTGGD